MLSKIDKYFYDVALWIQTHNPSKVKYSWTPEGSSFIRIYIGGFHIYLETYFDEEMEAVSVVSMWKDKELQLTYIGTLDNCFNEINDTMKHSSDGP